MYTPFARIGTGSVLTQLDSTPKNTVGAIWSPPATAGAPITTKGYGAQPVYKYVYYNSTVNPSPENAPAPVYYTDESFSTVSGDSAEAFFVEGGLGPCAAGYLMPNTTSITGLLATATATAPGLNQSYCWIQVGGWLGGAFAPTTLTGAGVGSYIYGTSTGNWSSVVNTTIGAQTRIFGVQWSVITNLLCDVLVGGPSVFWGS